MTEMPFTPPPPPPANGKQSRLGIAAFAVSILGLLIFCISILISAGYGVSIGLNNPAAAQNPYQAIDVTSPLMLVSIILSWCGPIMNFIGLVMGIIALFQKDARKTFAIISVVLSGLVVITFCGLTVFGALGQMASF